MALDLVTMNIPATVIKQGVVNVTMAANELLKIQAHNDQVFSEKVPSGKTWKVTIQLRIEEI